LKTADLINAPFVLIGRVGQRNHALDGVRIPYRKGLIWGMGRRNVTYSLGQCGIDHAKTAEPVELRLGTVSGVNTRNRVLDGRAVLALPH